MSSDDSIFYSNDGHDFHYLWTALRSLRMLDAKSDLVAIAVEGISPREESSGPSINDGVLVVDTTEYYGSESVEDSTSVIYCQLKHSTVGTDKPWTAAKLASKKRGKKDYHGTYVGFADRYKKLVAKHGKKTIQKVRFRLVTNCPISDHTQQALEAIVHPKQYRALSAQAKRDYSRLVEASGLPKKDLPHFIKLLQLSGDQESRAALGDMLVAEVGNLQPCVDLNVKLKLKEMVASRARSDGKGQMIYRMSVLSALGVPDRDGLLLTPSRFEADVTPLPREQEEEVVKAIKSTRGVPLIVHAHGGVGKTMLALRTKELLESEGHEIFLFDGFGGGDYKNPSDARHKHSRGLVHLANSMAARGLCFPLIPAPTIPPEDYLRAFHNRLKQAQSMLSSRVPNGKIIIILDAADNSETAAEESGTHSFAHDLLQENVPEGCRLVALCRSERRKILSPPRRVKQYLLLNFSRSETCTHLRRHYPDASTSQAIEFHTLTSGNARVQNKILSNTSMPLDQLLKSLAPGFTNDEMIASVLENALENVCRHSLPKTQVTNLCRALAILPPRVPIRILAHAADIEEAAISTFVTDFGRSLWVDNGAVQFRDEPVESWFHDRFSDTDKHLSPLIAQLKPLGETYPYVMAAMPSLLFRSGNVDQLIRLGLSTPPGLEGAVERREVVLRRIQYALKAAYQANDLKGYSKLLLRSAEEISTRGRQFEYLASNADLLMEVIEDKTTIPDLVFRHGRQWDGQDFASCAAMLASDGKYHGEAHSLLRSYEEWLIEWANDQSDHRNDITDSTRAFSIITYLYLYGPDRANKELKRWSPRSIWFMTGRLIARKLGDTSKKPLLNQLVESKEAPTELIMGVASALDHAALALPTKVIRSTIESAKTTKPVKASHYDDDKMLWLHAVVSIAKTGLLAGIDRDIISELLSAFTPTPPTHNYSNLPDNLKPAEIYAQFRSLADSIKNTTAKWQDLLSSEERNKTSQAFSNLDRDTRILKNKFGILLPWQNILSEIILGEETDDLLERLKSLASSTERKSWELRQSHEYHGILPAVGLIWSEILLRTNNLNDEQWKEFVEWTSLVNMSGYIYFWTDITRLFANHNSTQEFAIKSAMIAHDAIQAELEAETLAHDYSNLARAIFPVSSDEANALFQHGLDNVGKLGGMEAQTRLFTICSFAQQACRKNHRSDSKSVVRLARAAEHTYEVNNHKFSWDSVASALTGLCPKTALTAISRWRDRDVVGIWSTLPTYIKQALHYKILSPKEATALFPLAYPGDWWPIEEFAEKLLDHTEDESLKEKLTAIIARDMELLSGADASLIKFLEKANEMGVSNPRLPKIKSHIETAEKAEQQEKRSHYVADKTPEEQTDIADYLGDFTFVSPDEISQAAHAYYHDAKKPLEWTKEFWPALRARVPIKDRLKHLRALTKADLPFVYSFFEVLQAAVIDFGNTPAIKKELPNIVRDGFKTHQTSLLFSYYRLGEELQKASDLAGCEQSELLWPTLRAFADYFEYMNDEGVYSLAGRLVGQLDDNSVHEILGFALEQFEALMAQDKEEDWSSSETQREVKSEYLADFLRSCLAAPSSKTRWEATHAVRRLCELEERDVVDQLIKKYHSEENSAFTPAIYPFYHLHCRLHLLIAFARVAKDTPSFLAQYFNLFAHVATTDIPHILLRKYAAEILNAINNYESTVHSQDARQKANTLIASNLPNKSRDEVGPRARYDLHESYSSRQFDFEYDFEKHFIDPLADVFGLPFMEVRTKVEDWILNSWGYDKESGRNDPRVDRERQHRRTDDFERHDRFGFYLGYHAMLCYAGELIIDTPVVQGYDRWEEPWEEWIERHSLTRKDGFWLFDRRDYEPLEYRPWEIDKPSYSDPWRWDIQTTDFEAVLGLKHGASELNVWGAWYVLDGFGKRERINIRSALVSPTTSMALLRSLQTTDYPDSFSIPEIRDYDRDIRKQGRPFKLRGWISNPAAELRFDQHDPLGGGIGYPGPHPSKAIERLFNLTPRDDGRNWVVTDEEKVVLTSQIWGALEEDPNEWRRRSGSRLVADVDSLLAMLEQLESDLIISVQIKRDDRETVPYELDLPYFKLFVLKSNGTTHTLQSSCSIR